MTPSSGTPSLTRPYVLLALAVSLGVFLLRLHAFGGTEPRSDQAFFSWWAMGMEAADHILPVVAPGESLMNAMARDETGFLSQFLRPVYNSPTMGFDLLSICLMAGAGKLFGGGFATHVAVGILASAATVFVLALFPWWRRQEAVEEPFIAGGAALVLGATALYPYLFSALGPHNIGILFLVVGVVCSGWAIDALLADNRRMAWRAYLILLLVQGAAFYAYKTNVFLLPLATGLFIFSGAGPTLRRRIGVTLGYGVVVVLLVMPVVPFLVIDAAKASWARDVFSFSTMMAQASGGGVWGTAVRVGLRAGDWFKAGASLFSAPGLFGAFAGLAILAWQGRRWPACVVGAHFVAWCGVPLFSATELRTYPYVIPFLVVGFAGLIGWAAARWRGRGAEGWKRVPLVAAMLLAAAHLTTQVPGLLSRERLAEAYPEAWRQYFAGQGELRPMIARIERTLPPDAVLMTWGYGLQYLWRAFKDPADGTPVLPAISALMPRQQAGILPRYIARRHLHLAPDAPVFVLLDSKIDKVDEAGLRTQVAAVLGPSGFGLAGTVRLVERQRWTLRSSWPREVVLFEVRRREG